MLDHAGFSLASTIISALNQRAKVRLVAVDIKGAFDHVCWKGFLAHLWSTRFGGDIFHLFELYLSDRYIKVVTSVDASELHSISTEVPRGAIWSLLLFNLYIQLFPTVVKHCLLIGYADENTLLKIIPQKLDCCNAAAQINVDLNALYQFGHPWNIEFSPHMTFSLIISLKTNISEHVYE